MISLLFRVAVGLVLGQVVCWGQQGLRVSDLPMPTYSHPARMARLEGAVVVEVEIGRDGRVVRATARGGHALLQREARDNARQWTFANFPPNCKFPFKHRVRYIYRLEGDNSYEDPPALVNLTLPDRVEIVSQPPTVESSQR